MAHILQMRPRGRIRTHQIGAVRMASRDLTAAPEEQKGGDAHDVVDTPFGVRLLIADVMGKDQRAARTAARILSAFRDLAPYEVRLSSVAQRMHGLLASHGDDEEFATALLMTIRDEAGEAELVCCGHPRPLLLRGRQVSFIETLPVSPPLGLLDLADGWCESVTVPFGEGDQLLLYTDGVTEARNADGWFYPLPERVAALRHEDPDVMVDSLATDLHRYVAGRFTDAATLLLVHCDRSHVRR